MKSLPGATRAFHSVTAVILAMTILLAGCKPPQLNSNTPEDPEKLDGMAAPEGAEESKQLGAVAIREDISYPITRNLSDARGRSFEASILGRGEAELYVERAADGSKFTLPLTKLGEEDQRYAESLPVTGKPELSEEEKIAQDPYLNVRQKEIDRLQYKLDGLRKEEESDPGQLRLRRLKKEVVQFKQEIAELEREMESHLGR